MCSVTPIRGSVPVKLQPQPFELNPGLPLQGEPIADYAARFGLTDLPGMRARVSEGLLGMSQRIDVKSVAADILYNAPDPFARKVILDRGAQQGVEPGLAVVDAQGVIGQVTRVHPIQSEVTLLTDRRQSIPVSVVRNGVRGVLYGTGRGSLEMRHVLADVDIQPGDQLVTSGLDGVYVPGLPVAKVLSVNREADAFAALGGTGGAE